jgi:TatD DNase family protein
MIDTHCHLTFEPLHVRLEQVLADACAAGVRGVITVSTSAANAVESRAIVDRFASAPAAGGARHPAVWFTAGVHPLYADQPLDWPTMKGAASHPRCVAWGELGLDHHYADPPRALQLRVLEEQLAFIESCHGDGLRKPIIVHCREAFRELLEVFRSAGARSRSAFDPSRFVFHCFTGGPDDARAVLDFGAWISFTGIVTFANAPEVAAAARLVPLDRMMVETDAPFLTPEPHRKVRPNEPKFVVHVARFLAQLRGKNPIELERQLDANAERFFGIRLPAGAQPPLNSA